MIDWIKAKLDGLWQHYVDLTEKYPQLKLAVVSLGIVLGAAYFVKKFLLS